MPRQCRLVAPPGVVLALARREPSDWSRSWSTHSMLAVVAGAFPAAPLASKPVRDLITARREVSCVQARAWTDAVKKRDPVELLKRGMHPHPISRAYFKLCEMQPLLPKEIARILLICEAPGGFFQAAQTLYPHAVRYATSLEGNSCIRFNRLVSSNVIADLPESGDICKESVVDSLIERLGEHSFDLITADGGIYHQDLDMVEQSSLHLLIAQIIVALRMNTLGGSCVIKLFEGSTQPTRDAVAIMRKLYREVHVYKPRTSKAANSERYLIGVCALSVERCDEVATFLRRSMSFPHVLGLLSVVDAAISNAFDALATKQTCELQRLLKATHMEKDACDALTRLAMDDVAWIKKNVKSLGGERELGTTCV